MNERNKRKAQKKSRQSILERELMAFLNAYVRQCVEKALDDIFRDFKI